MHKADKDAWSIILRSGEIMLSDFSRFTAGDIDVGQIAANFKSYVRQIEDNDAIDPNVSSALFDLWIDLDVIYGVNVADGKEHLGDEDQGRTDALVVEACKLIQLIADSKPRSDQPPMTKDV